MPSNRAPAQRQWFIVFTTMIAGWCACVPLMQAATDQKVLVRAAGFSLGAEKSVFDGTNHFELMLDQSNRVASPFTQSAVKQSVEPARLGPDPKIPYFTVRFALPIPPENATNNVAALTGMDPDGVHAQSLARV